MKNDKLIKLFKKTLLPQILKEYNTQGIIIFGSRIIVSKSFQEIPFIERMPSLLKKFDFPRHIDYICYTPEEFERIKGGSSLVIDALEYGEIIS